MAKLTFFPLGNADSTLIDLSDGRKLLFDYADTRNKDDTYDRRIDLPEALRRDLRLAERNYYDVVAITHLDTDHVQGASDFFYMDHASKYQDDERIRIRELWVPAAAILEEGTTGDGRVIRQEARYRLERGSGVRVFSRPEKLRDWLASKNLSLEDRAHLITDAGKCVPTFSLENDSVEFFVHSPFAHRFDGGEPIDRNSDALVFQTVFREGGVDTRVMLMGDADHEVITSIVEITKSHDRDDRLNWDVSKLPHHCSYLSLSPEKGTTVTVPTEGPRQLFAEGARPRSVFVSSSDSIPEEDTDQPPHRQAAAYYLSVAHEVDGQFKVTMENPSRGAAKAAPVVIRIDHLGATPLIISGGGSAQAVSEPAPRAGKEDA